MQTAPDERVREAGQSVRQAGTATVLVVEEGGVVRGLLMRILSLEGYRVLGAASGSEAIAAAREGSIDLLVTGLDAADMSGADLAERLVADRPELAVLYLSGVGDRVEPRPGPSRPGVGLLARPITAEVLTRRVRELLERSG
jgi:two-component system cell cycle sensor histidine kinase/response regulator CckA